MEKIKDFVCATASIALVLFTVYIVFSLFISWFGWFGGILVGVCVALIVFSLNK